MIFPTWRSCLKNQVSNKKSQEQMSSGEKIAKVDLVRSVERKVDGKHWQN